MQYRAQTTMATPEVLELAKTYFGPAGKGLTLISQRRRALSWQGTVGQVNLIVKSDAPTLLEIETRGWESAVQQFIAQLPQQQSWWARLWHRKPAAKPPTPVHT